MPRVLNKRTDVIPPDAIYVGRPTRWGNPYKVKGTVHNMGLTTLNYPKGYTRDEAISKYIDWIEKSDLINHIEDLRGKDLVCWCAPELCHADYLLSMSNADIPDEP